MTVTLGPDAIVLEGSCGVEEADALLRLLEEQPHMPVALSSAGTLHTAVWQVLLMAKRDLLGSPSTPPGAALIVAAIQENCRISGG